MEKSLCCKRIFSLLIAALVLSSFCSGCAPTYPKERLAESLMQVCKEEYEIDIQAKLVGKTIVVFIPFDELFDIKLDILPEAVSKIEDVILSTSRVLFSTDADVDFYMIIAADVKTTSAEVILVRYLDDVYKFMHGWINRDSYRKRVLWQVNLNPKLLRQAEFDFDVQEMTLPDFLAQQTAQRIDMLLGSSVVYKAKIKADYDEDGKQFKFSLVAVNNNRFRKIYVPIILQQADAVLREYKFGDFAKVHVKNQLLRNSIIVDKDELKEYKNVNVDELLTQPFYD